MRKEEITKPKKPTVKPSAKKPAQKTKAKTKPAPKTKTEDKETKTKPPEKMLMFAAEYIIDFNGTAAAERAGYVGTKESLGVMASRMLRHVRVIAEMERLLEKRNKGRELRKARVINGFEKIAFDPDEIEIKYDKSNKKGKNKNNENEDRILSVSRADKLSALKALGQIEGMFNGKDDDDEGHGMGGVILLPVKMVGEAWAQQYSGEKQ